MLSLLGVIAVALSPGLGNFATAIALGLFGVDAHLRFRVACVFGFFGTAIPLGGLLLGLTGLDTLGSAVRSRADTGTAGPAWWGLPRLLLVGAALGLDNLLVDFALGTHHRALVPAAITIGTASIALSLLGLELGARLDTRYGPSRHTQRTTRRPHPASHQHHPRLRPALTRNRRTHHGAACRVHGLVTARFIMIGVSEVGG